MMKALKIQNQQKLKLMTNPRFHLQMKVDSFILLNFHFQNNSFFFQKFSDVNSVDENATTESPESDQEEEEAAD